MPRTCTCCTHPERAAIDAALLANAPLRDIARQFNVSKDALQRHREHIPATLAKAQEAREVANADDLLGQVKSLQARAMGILATAESTLNLRTALAAIREARGCIELLAKLTGELNENPVVNITISQEWLEVRTVLLAALERHPEAKQTVLEALGQVSA